VKIRAKRGAGGLNFSAPKFQAAQKACQGLLPGPPGGAKGGGPASSKSSGGGAGAGASLSLQTGG
ncbi:MAG: hypothetical protein ACYDHT_10330, partial [Solirubrobacteraceae bacterium]